MLLDSRSEAEGKKKLQIVQIRKGENAETVMKTMELAQDLARDFVDLKIEGASHDWTAVTPTRSAVANERDRRLRELGLPTHDASIKVTATKKMPAKKKKN